MTIPYNVTVNGVVSHLKEFFYVEFKDTEYLYIPKDPKYGTSYINGADLFMLAKIIHNILYETHPELSNVVSYFKNMVNLLTQLELPIVWITPAGLKIKQKYARKKSTRVRSGLYKNADYTIVIPTGDFDKVSQANAFMPNLIHSLDGSTITLLIQDLKILNIHLYTIHDCFATTANYISILNTLVRLALCEIYSDEKFLVHLHEFFIDYIEGNYNVIDNKIVGPNGLVEIPTLPKTGDFKNFNDNIKKAIYMIS